MLSQTNEKFLTIYFNMWIDGQQETKISKLTRVLFKANYLCDTYEYLKEMDIVTDISMMEYSLSIGQIAKISIYLKYLKSYREIMKYKFLLSLTCLQYCQLNDLFCIKFLDVQHYVYGCSFMVWLPLYYMFLKSKSNDESYLENWFFTYI